MKVIDVHFTKITDRVVVRHKKKAYLREEIVEVNGQEINSYTVNWYFVDGKKPKNPDKLEELFHEYYNKLRDKT